MGCLITPLFYFNSVGYMYFNEKSTVIFIYVERKFGFNSIDIKLQVTALIYPIPL